MSQAKVKTPFTHKGKAYKPGDTFEGDEQEIASLASLGRVEHPQAQGEGTIGHKHGQEPPKQGQ